MVAAKARYLSSQLDKSNRRSGRQKKPLEVLGVYDPIPRHPTMPDGQVLTDQAKIKKISINVDRVKYWLSVGAQPTDHVQRLLSKAELVPPKPRYSDRMKPAKHTTVTAWGFATQGPTEKPAVSVSESITGQEKVIPSVIASSGTHIEKGARDVSRNLVSFVLKESRRDRYTVHPGQTGIDSDISTLTRRQFRTVFNEFLNLSPKESKDDTDKIRNIKWTDNQGRYPFMFRVFLAYILPGQPLALRSRFLVEWVMKSRKEIIALRHKDLFQQLNAMFTMWEEVVDQLEAKGLWTGEQKEMMEDIRQRARLFRLAETDLELREKELEGWRAMFENHNLTKSQTTKTAHEESVKEGPKVTDTKETEA